MDIPYERKNLEWKPVIGFEDEYLISNYGDLIRKKREFIDKAGKYKIYNAKIFWSEEQSLGGGSNGNNYKMVNVKGNKLYSHRVAAQAFISNPLNKPAVNHIDGDTKNNYVGCKELNYTDSNLEWVTNKENMEHASKHGLINKDSEKRKIQCAKNREKVDYTKLMRPVVQINPETGEAVTQYQSISEAARVIGVINSTIHSVVNREGYHKTAGGFGWIYLDEYDPTKDNRVIVDRGSGNRRAIKQLSLDHEIVATYSSPMEAERLNKEQNFNNKYIRDCCWGKRKTHKGYLWEFA